MAIFNFGPATVTHNGVALGDTYGGGSLSFNTTEEVLIDGEIKEYITSGTGSLNLFQYDGSFDIDQNEEFSSYAVMTIVGTQYSITLQSAKLLYPEGISFGQNQQKAITLRFVFKADSNGDILQIT